MTERKIQHSVQYLHCLSQGAVESECVCMRRYTSVLKYCAVLKCFVEESHQLFGFLRLLPRLYSLSLHRSSDVLPRCLSLFACDPSQLLLYNGLLLLIPVQAHTQLYLHACCQAMIHSLQFLNLPLSFSVLSFVLVLVSTMIHTWRGSRKK